MRNSMRAISRLAVAVIALGCVGCDQVTKALAREHLARRPPLTYLDGTVRLQYTENAGAFLSLGSGLPEGLRFWVFTVFTAVALVALVGFVVVRRELSTFARVALALIIGGAAGNLIDRVWNHGFVVDFLNLGIGSVRTGIFNVADVAIVAGGAMLLLVRHEHRPPDEAAVPPVDAEAEPPPAP